VHDGVIAEPVRRGDRRVTLAIAPMVAFRMARDPPPASPSSVAEHTAERKETEMRKAIVLLGLWPSAW